MTTHAKPLPPIERFDASSMVQVSLASIREQLLELSERTTSNGTKVRFLYLKQGARKGPNLRTFLLMLNRHLVAYAIHNAPQYRFGNDAYDPDAVQDAHYLARTKFRLGDKTGQLGEFIVFCLVEALLGAPQAVAKMHYKGENQMEVPGMDGIHARWDEDKKRLFNLRDEDFAGKSA